MLRRRGPRSEGLPTKDLCNRSPLGIVLPMHCRPDRSSAFPKGMGSGVDQEPIAIGGVGEIIAPKENEKPKRRAAHAR